MRQFQEGDIVRVVTQPTNQRFVHLVGEVGTLSEIDQGLGMLETFKSDSNACGGSGWVTLASLVHEDSPEAAAMKAAREAERARILQAYEARSARIDAVQRGLAEKYGIPTEAVDDICVTMRNAREP